MATQSPTPSNAGEALDQLGRLALRDHSMSSLLQTVAELARTVLPGNPETSVSVLVRNKATTAVSTGALAVELDESQYDHGYGPCLHAARAGEVVEVVDSRTDERWPDYLRQAVEKGALGSLSLPLSIDPQVSGALNIYTREANAFDDDSRATAGRFAPYAAVAVGNMQAYQDARDMADNLQAALESRAVIDQAKGILMERHRIPPDRAFQVLAQVSMGTNIKVRDVAERLVRTGELPAPRRPRATGA